MRSDLDALIKSIKPVRQSIQKEAINRFDQLTKPTGSLGYLEDLTARAAAVYGKLNPRLSRKIIFLMAADHGVAEEKISAYPSEITHKMVCNFLNGGAAINVLARHFGTEVIITDMGVKGTFENHSAIIDKKLAQGTHNMAIGPAMSREMAYKAIWRGYQVFNEMNSQQNIDLIGLGEMGIGNTTASSAIIALLTGHSIEKVADVGTGLNARELQHKIKIIKQAFCVNQPNAKDAIDVLAKVGGFEIGGLVGCIFAAAQKRIPIFVDGFISGACVLLANLMAPQVKDYLFASHCSREKGHRLTLAYLKLKPMFDLEMHLGEGTGAIFGMNFLEAGFKLLNQMATFEEMDLLLKQQTGVK